MSGFNLHLADPVEPLSAMIQGIWSASVCQSDGVQKSLYSDACSGIIFNLGGEIIIGDSLLPEGVILLPVNKRTEKITLPPGAQLSGIRFQPAMGYGVFGEHYRQPVLLKAHEDQLYGFHRIYSELRLLESERERVEALNAWVASNMFATHQVPDLLLLALKSIKQDGASGVMSTCAEVSQRQIQRLFRRFLGMTSKRYQRIMRIKKTVEFLRQHHNPNLADVALKFGFSDQSHMTREFRLIACTTPGKI